MAAVPVGGLMEDDPQPQPQRQPRRVQGRPDRNEDEWRRGIEARLANIDAKLDVVLRQLQDINTTVKNTQAAGLRMVTHQGRFGGGQGGGLEGGF